MKAVVLHQPYATLVALGVKTIETRPSPPNGPMRPQGVRGLPGLSIEAGERIAVVAGAKVPAEGMEVGCWTIERWRDGTGGPCMVSDGGHRDPVDLPLGVVVCTAVVADAYEMVTECGGRDHIGIPAWPGWAPTLCIDDVNIDLADQWPLGDFAPGRWGWLLTGVQRCDPVPVKGRQGVFLLPADVAAGVTR